MLCVDRRGVNSLPHCLHDTFGISARAAARFCLASAALWQDTLQNFRRGFWISKGLPQPAHSIMVLPH
jgi:hypothetical protein